MKMTTLAVLMAAGLSATTATAQDTAAVGAGNAAQRSPSTTPNDVPVTGQVVTGPVVPGSTVPGRPAALAPVTGFTDGLFAAAAASGGMSEVAMARIAVERGGCDEVKMFAQKMLADHTKANNELMALASSKAMPLPMALESRDRAEQGILLGLSGEEFDKAYIHQQLAAHICAVGLFEAEAERGRDPQMKAWAAKILPTLKEHKQHVKRMHDEMAAKMKDKSAAR